MCGPKKKFLTNKKVKYRVIGYTEYESDIRFVIFDRFTKILPTFTKIEKMDFHVFFMISRTASEVRFRP
jgi:hypothetical protein